MGMQGIIPPNIDYNKNVSDRYEKKIYKKGETCIKYNKLHQAKENIDAPEEWNPVHWEETTVEQIRAQIQQKLSVVNTNIANITPDDTAVDGKPWTSKHIVDMLCPPLKVSGNPVQCYPVAGYPLGITASWEPTQEGTGDPSPDNIRPIKGRDSVAVTRCGANLFDYEKFKQVKCVGGTAVYENNGVTVTANKNDCYTAYIKADGFPDDCRIPVKPGETITLSWEESTNTSGIVFIFPNAKAAGGVTVNNASQKSVSYAVAEGVSFISYRFGVANAGDTIAYKNIQCTIGAEVPTVYTPYTGDTTTLTLPETIYGGTVDAVSGQGQKKWESIAISNLKEVSTFTYGGKFCYRWRTTNCQKIICNKLKSLVNWTSPMADYSIEIQDGNYQNVVIFVPGMTTKGEYESWISENAPIFVYKRRNEIPFEASGAQDINALSGFNTVLTDADSVEVTGREDLIHAITGQ